MRFTNCFTLVSSIGFSLCYVILFVFCPVLHELKQWQTQRWRKSNTQCCYSEFKLPEENFHYGSCLSSVNIFLQKQPTEVFYKKLCFKKLTGKHLCRSLFLKKRLRHLWFPVNFAKFLRKFFIIHLNKYLFLRSFIGKGKPIIYRNRH